MKIPVKCNSCGESFMRETKSVNRSRKLGLKLYCSPACQRSVKLRRFKFSCAFCGNEGERSANQQSRSASGNHYCSKSCRAKHINIGNSYNRKDGGSVYRKHALKHYGAACRVCGYDVEVILEVHHRDKNRHNNTLGNLDVLCPTHHNEYHFGIRFYPPQTNPDEPSEGSPPS